MKKIILALLFSAVALDRVLAHASAALHFKDCEAVFSGYGVDKNFKALFRVVSGGVDNDLPKAFTNAIGPIPGNHRILGHGWTLNAAIPKATMEKLEERYPGKKKEIRDVWIQFARGCIEKSEELSGLPKKQANALASLIYDIHLVGDLEPDNKLIAPVLELGEIVKNIQKDCAILFVNKPQHSDFVNKKLDETMQSKLPYQEKASLVMQTLYDLRLGTMLNDTWGNTLKFKYSPDANVNARGLIAERTAKTDPVAVEAKVGSASVKLYKVSASGKIHNFSCEYYAVKGELTSDPKGENCKKCGGASK
jgi:hypothetical protein